MSQGMTGDPDLGQVGRVRKDLDRQLEVGREDQGHRVGE